MAIYGMQVAHMGPSRRNNTELNTSQVVFRRDNVNTVDIWQTDLLDQAEPQMVYGRTPLLFRRGDNLTVDFVPRRADEAALHNETYQPVSRSDWGNNDDIMLLGTVVEPLGTNITGDSPIQRAISRPGRQEPSPDQVAQKLFFSYLSKEDKQSWQKHKVIL